MKKRATPILGIQYVLSELSEDNDAIGIEVDRSKSRTFALWAMKAFDPGHDPKFTA